jgi:hypothetical protein
MLTYEADAAAEAERMARELIEEEEKSLSLKQKKDKKSKDKNAPQVC